jgi:hypothetical protein
VRAVPKGGGPVITIATGQGKPLRLSLDATYVYWTNNLGGAVMRAPKDGSAPPSIVSTAMLPQGIVVSGSYVYFTNGDGTIQRAPASGGTPMLWTTYTVPSVGDQGPDSPFELVSDGAGTALWGNFNYSNIGYYGVIVETAMATGSVVATRDIGLDQSQLGMVTGYPLAVDAKHVFTVWGNFEVVLSWYDKSSLQAAGGDLVLDNQPQTKVAAITSIPCAVLWTSAHTISSTQIISSLEMYVFGTTSQVSLLSTSGNRLASDGSFVYWTDASGAIGKLPLPM